MQGETEVGATAPSRLARLAERVLGMAPPGPRGRRFARDAGFDTMGCVLMGAGHPVAKAARAALGGYPGAAPIYGTGLGAAAPFAALCNATAGHALDFDDWEEPGNTHPSVVIFPALWALACERAARGRVFSGADVLTAYAAGFETIARLGEALNFEHYNRGWHTTATLGAPGAAAACARLLGLSAAQTTHALSLALSQASGYVSQFGSAAKPLQAGFAARDGVSAALFAEAGLTGRPGVLDGAKGFAALAAHGDLARLDAVWGAMEQAGAGGAALDAWGVVLKPYPCCGYTHRLIDCAIDLHGRVDMGDIVRIRAELPDFHYAVLAFDDPVDRAQAAFSAPYAVATALAAGRFGLADLEPTALKDPGRRAALRRVEMAPQPPRRPELNYDPDQPDRLIVTVRGGAELQAVCAYPKGAPQNPMSPAALRAKFTESLGPMSAGAVDALFAWDGAPAVDRVLDPFGAEP